MPNDNPVDPRTEQHLRVEAGAAQWQEFDEAQQIAYIRIAKMIAEALTDLPPLDQTSGSGRLRRTRSAFVTGGRGTGKTTLIETFRRESEPTWSEPEVRDRPETNDETRERLRKLDRERTDLLQRTRGRIVWLETLDMEPLSPDTNLLASILARLEDAVRVYGLDSGTAQWKPRGLVEPSSEYHGALLDLQRLQTDVALAWDGNLRERQGSLDPDAFAVEVMRVEKARLSLNTKFAETLRKLAAHVFEGRRLTNVLFVLPVDDFDLNPPICLDLLRVLRLISVPRLFTLVSGDLHVASTVLSLKMSNDLGSIARRLRMEMLAVLPGTVAALAGDVAANAIRKLLPPGQRIDLSPMRVAESLNFRPLGSTDATPYLHELLARCLVHTGRELPPIDKMLPTIELGDGSLLQVLLAPPLSVIPPRTVDGSQKPDDRPPQKMSRAIPREVPRAAIYSGTRFLEAPPRRIADTWLELYKVAPEAGPDTVAMDGFEPLLTYFAEACRAALSETPIFGPFDREDIDRAVSRNVAGSWTLRALPLSFRTETVARRPIELTPLDRRPRPKTTVAKTTAATKRSHRTDDSPTGPTAEIITADSLGWQMEAYRGELAGAWGREGSPPPGVGHDWEVRRPRRLITGNAVTALIMYHDLLAFAPGQTSFVTPLLTPSNLEIDWAATEWKLSSPVRFNWPAPPSTTFFDYDRFKAGWNEVIKDPEIVDSSTHDEIVERLAFAWLSLGTAVVLKRNPVLMERDQPIPWRTLIKSLADAEVQGHEGDRWVEWLSRVLELLMPEMGWPSRVTSAFADIPDRVRRQWHRNALVVKRRRARRLKQLNLVDPKVASLASRFTKLASEFAPEPDEFENDRESGTPAPEPEQQ